MMGNCNIFLVPHGMTFTNKCHLCKITKSYEGQECFLVGFVALRPKSTAMVIAGRSVHLTTLFPGQA